MDSVRSMFGWNRNGVNGHTTAQLNGAPPANGQAPSLAWNDDRDQRTKGGPEGVVLPWFSPFWSEGTHETEEIRRAFRAMPRDPNVKAALLGKIYAVSSLPLKIKPPRPRPSKLDDMGQPKDPQSYQREAIRFATDRQVAEFTEWNLKKRLNADGRGGLPRAMEDVFYPGLIDGYSVCEKVRAPQQDGRWAGKQVLSALKSVQTYQNVVLQTNDNLDVVDVMGLTFNAGLHFDPLKFVIWQHLPVFESPLGTSDLRAAYSRWWMLETVLKLRALFHERRAVPFIVGTYKQPSTQASVDRQMASLKRFGYVGVPETVTLTLLNAAGAAESEFKSFTDDLIEQIFLGITGATLQHLTGGEGEQRGNSRVQQSTSGRFNWRLAESWVQICNDMTRGLIKFIVDPNFQVEEYPVASLDLVDADELKGEAEIDKFLSSIGWQFSKTEFEERYGRKWCEDPEDLIKPPQAGPQPGQPGVPPGTPGASPMPLGGSAGGGSGQVGGPAGSSPAKPPAAKLPMTSDHPEAFAEHDVSGERRDDSGKWTSGNAPKKRVFQRGEEIALAHHKGTEHALGGVKSGRVPHETARARLALTSDKAAAEVDKNFRGRFSAFQARIAAEHGNDSVQSPEWAQVRKVFQGWKGSIENAVRDKGAVADAAIKHHKEHGSFPSGTKQDLAERSDELVQMHHDFSTDLGKAMDEFRAKHPIKPGAVFSEEFNDHPEAFAEWDEAKHPRGDGGKFGAGSAVHNALSSGHHSIKQLAKLSGAAPEEISTHLSGLHSAGQLETGFHRGQGTYKLKGGLPANEFGSAETQDEPPTGMRNDENAAYRVPKASEARLREVGEHQKRLIDGMKDANGIVYIPALRERMKGVPRREFDDSIRQLRRDKTLRVVAVGDLSDHTTAQLDAGVPGVNETFLWVEPGSRWSAVAVPQVSSKVSDAVSGMLGDSEDEMLPIHRLRQAVGSSDRAGFDEAVKQMSREGKIRLVSASVPETHGTEEKDPTGELHAKRLADSIPGASETFYYIKRGPNWSSTFSESEEWSLRRKYEAACDAYREARGHWMSFAEHDVSDQPRDDDGKWTSGHQEKLNAARDAYKQAKEAMKAAREELRGHLERRQGARDAREAAKEQREAEKEAAVEAKYKTKAVGVAAKINPEHSAVILDAIGRHGIDPTPEQKKKGLIKGLATKGSILEGLAEHGVTERDANKILDRMVYTGRLVEHQFGQGIGKPLAVWYEAAGPEVEKFSESDWSSISDGPLGGKRWQNGSGRVVYSHTNPGAGGGHGVVGQVNAAKEHEGARGDLAYNLAMNHSHGELKSAAKKLGVGTHGTQKDLVERLEEHAWGATPTEAASRRGSGAIARGAVESRIAGACSEASRGARAGAAWGAG